MSLERCLLPIKFQMDDLYIVVAVLLNISLNVYLITNSGAKGSRTGNTDYPIIYAASSILFTASEYLISRFLYTILYG